jgi:hypothetical protein
MRARRKTVAGIAVAASFASQLRGQSPMNWEQIKQKFEVGNPRR